MLRCENSRVGIPEGCIVENQFTMLKGGVLAIPGFTFDTEADFADEDKWLEYMADGKLFPIPDVKESENQNVEDGVYETPDGEKSFLYNGNRGYVLKVKYTLARHKVLFTYSNTNWDIFKIDKVGNIMGQSVDGTKVGGFKTNYFQVGKQDNNVGADSPAYTIVTIQEKIVEEWDKNGRAINPDWLALNLKGVTTLTAEASTVAANVFTLTVNYVDGSTLESDGSDRSAAKRGLVPIDLEIIDQAGAILSNSGDYTVTETAVYGVYTVDCTVGTITSGTVQIKASATNLYTSAQVTLSA